MHTTPLDAVLGTTIQVILQDRAGMTDINTCQDAGIDIITACRNLYGWTSPANNIARAEMNAARYAQALALALAHTRQ